MLIKFDVLDLYIYNIPVPVIVKHNGNQPPPKAQYSRLVYSESCCSAMWSGLHFCLRTSAVLGL